MDIKVTIEATELTKALEKLADSLIGIVQTDTAKLQHVQTVAKTAVPDSRNKSKTAKAVEKEDLPWKEDEAAKDPEKANEATIVDARKALAGLAGKGMKAEAKKILSDLGCNQLSDVDPTEYSTIITKCKEVA